MKNNRIAIALIVLSLLLFGIGVAAGQPALVLSKARVICMECIGLE